MIDLDLQIAEGKEDDLVHGHTLHQAVAHVQGLTVDIGLGHLVIQITVDLDHTLPVDQEVDLVENEGDHTQEAGQGHTVQVHTVVDQGAEVDHIGDHVARTEGDPNHEIELYLLKAQLTICQRKVPRKIRIKLLILKRLIPLIYHCQICQVKRMMK